MVFLDDVLDVAQFVRFEPARSRLSNGIEPEFCLFSFPANVNVRRFVYVRFVEPEFVSVDA